MHIHVNPYNPYLESKSNTRKKYPNVNIIQYYAAHLNPETHLGEIAISMFMVENDSYTFNFRHDICVNARCY